jgi:hypothetical protein
MKKINIVCLVNFVSILLLSSCEDFLTTFPKDAMSPPTTWQTESDAEKFLVGCYNGWLWGEEFYYMDTTSDIGFSFHTHENYRVIGDGSMGVANTGTTRFYTYTRIRRVNTLLANIDKVAFRDQAIKNDIIAQARFIRASEYFKMNWLYGGVPMIDLPESADDAQVPRETESKVKQFVFDELDWIVANINERPGLTGQVAKGAALMLKMRSALYYTEYQRALDAAKAIKALGQYELHRAGGANAFSDLFSYAGKNSREIILSVQKVNPGDIEWIRTILNNEDGGWSSMVPTQALVDMYEMANGLLKDEPGSGYDPTHPFYGRDPRMAMTILVPGIDWRSSHYRGILNTLDQTTINPATGNEVTNLNFPTTANNSSKTGLNWAKFILPIEQYVVNGVLIATPTTTQYIVFRYAEALLTLAEASNELNGPSAEVYEALDDIRDRAGMPKVDRTKYGTKETLRELIRRERTIELAGEGHRRYDIVRWKDVSGKMLAETVMNATLTRVTGTINYDEPEPLKRAVISGVTPIGEIRTFRPYNRHLPFSQSMLDRNRELVQNDGY